MGLYFVSETRETRERFHPPSERFCDRIEKMKLLGRRRRHAGRGRGVCRWRRLRLASTRQWHAVCTISASSSARRSKRGKHSHDERRKATSVEEAIDQLARRLKPAGLLPRDVPRDGNCFFHANVPTSLRTRSFGRVEAARLLKSKSRQDDHAFALLSALLSVRVRLGRGKQRSRD